MTIGLNEGTGSISFAIELDLPRQEGVLVAPSGLATPHGRTTGLEVSGGSAREIGEAGTGQTALAITPESDTVRLHYSFEDTGSAYPDAIYQPRDSRFTRAAEALIAEAQAIAPDAPPRARAQAIACATAERFTYGHPKVRFTDGLDHVPHLGCGLTEGSCVDINTYFLASLRAAGIEAGYITGFFFPAEKGDWCEDGHCWVVTRAGGVVEEWDIAHHLKLGTRDIRPALNPKPGFRAAIFHGMGLDFPAVGVTGHKAMTQPLWARDGRMVPGEISIRLRHPRVVPTAAE